MGANYRAAAETISAHIVKNMSKGMEQDEAIAAAVKTHPDALHTKSNHGMQYGSILLKEAEVDIESMEFAGYASTYDRDEVDDIIHPGAFTRTISQRGPEGAGKIKVLWQHADPMGVPLEMREDERGLYTRSRISDTTLGRDAMKLIRDGVVDRMSIGFSIPEGKAEFREDGWTRDIREVKLYEYSAVTFAANEEAVIEMAARATRSHNGDHLSERSKAQILDAIKRMGDALGMERDSPKGTPGDNGDSGVSDSLHGINDLANWARHRVL